MSVDALRWTIALSLGEPLPDGGPADWDAVRAVAGVERCLGVAWLRAGAYIRHAAPLDVSCRWRAEVATLDDASRRQLRELVRVVPLLESAGISPVVLKGAPLSLQLYGDPFVRHSADLDLFVAASEWERAHATLVGDGWTRSGGGSSGEALYWRDAGEIRTLLELHCDLAGDELLRFLRFRPPTRHMEIVAGALLPVFGGEQLPAYLAAHLAKHTSAPILWLVDFRALWESLGSGARAAARIGARSAGAERHLEWCIVRAASLAAAAHGDGRALRRCGGMSGLVREPHAIVRNARLAARPGEGVSMVVGWVARRARNVGRSPLERRGRLAWIEGVAARVRAIAGGPPRSARVAARERLLQLGAEESLSLVRESVAAGGVAWLIARGSSMWPAIPSGARVRIAPWRTRGLRVGDVALVDAGGSEPVLHRVVALTDATVTLRGDNMSKRDVPLPRERIVGVATHVIVRPSHVASTVVRGRLRLMVRRWWRRAIRAAVARIAFTRIRP